MPFEITTASESVTSVGEQCKVTATGTLRTNGAGGTVTYYWVRKDDNGTHVQPQQQLTILKGDTSLHAVAKDQWTSSSSGSEQLVFVSPSYPLAAQSFSCSG